MGEYVTKHVPKYIFIHTPPLATRTSIGIVGMTLLTK